MMVEEHGGLQMLIPGDHLIIGHLYRGLGRSKAVVTGKVMNVSECWGWKIHLATYFDISRVDTVIPLHNKTIRPVRATATRNRVRVKNIKMAFHGGSLDLADFQFTPPLGSNMVMDEEGGIDVQESGRVEGCMDDSREPL